METTITLNGKQIRIIGRYAGRRVSNWGGSENQHHVITVYVGETFVQFDYWASKANPRITTEQELLDAFNCFISDAISGEYDFSEFCDEFCYDKYNEEGDIHEEHRKIHLACVALLNKYNELDLGDIYDLANELREKYDL